MWDWPWADEHPDLARDFRAYAVIVWHTNLHAPMGEWREVAICAPNVRQTNVTVPAGVGFFRIGSTVR
jgi:hypothetical protein